jgi:Raf kinase inhibitor-like YbhB/YbcL family protein
MELRSPAFEDNELIPSRYTCDGEDINPPLEISGVPKETKSLALIMEDPDVPTGTWIHWTLWNIDTFIDQIPAGKAPLGSIEGVTDFGRPGYGGPCPPEGRHRYVLTLYALDTKLDLTASRRAGDLLKAMKGHIVESCTLVGLYSRNGV